MATVMEERILKFLKERNDGHYHSVDLLFSDFLKFNVDEFIENQKVIREAINSCLEKSFIEYDERPEYFIHITASGRNQVQ
ncbi:MAG: hypothetical protein K6G18_12970 [Treponema sp.]|nr:hypothetical protein [Treponema sp.]